MEEVVSEMTWDAQGNGQKWDRGGPLERPGGCLLSALMPPAPSAGPGNVTRRSSSFGS
jgi:hypothetical protein